MQHFKIKIQFFSEVVWTQPPSADPNRNGEGETPPHTPPPRVLRPLTLVPLDVIPYRFPSQIPLCEKR